MSHDMSTTTADPPTHLRLPRRKGKERLIIAAFPGSFAAPGRPSDLHDDVPRPWYRCPEYLLRGWGRAEIWRSAVIEGVGTSGLVFVSGQITGTIMSYGTPQIGAYVGISNIILLSLFIYGTSPASGGHLNPMITLSTVLCGLCQVSRGVLYMIFQLLGSALAGGLLRGIWGRDLTMAYKGGGCFFDAAIIPPWRVYLNELFSSVVLLFISYGVGLDPQQAILFGPRMGPLLVGATLGLVSFSSSGTVEGYAGAQMNPGRCFAYGIARGNMSGQWIWFFAPAAAAVIQAILYNSIPPYHAEHEAARQAHTHTHHDVNGDNDKHAAREIA